MTSFPLSPRVVSGGLVIIDPGSSRIERIIVLQYNPDSLQRTLQIQGAGAESGDRLDVLRLKGAPVEAIKLEAEIDAADQLEVGDPSAGVDGIHPQLAALESCVYPSSGSVQTNLALSAVGILEIIPAPAPLTLFVWGRRRVLPVRITELSVTEEAFTPTLSPLRAKVSLSLRVLGVNDVPRGHRAAALAMARHQGLEQLAATVSGRINSLGIRGLP